MGARAGGKVVRGCGVVLWWKLCPGGRSTTTDRWCPWTPSRGSSPGGAVGYSYIIVLVVVLLVMVLVKLVLVLVVEVIL